MKAQNIDNSNTLHTGEAMWGRPGVSRPRAGSLHPNAETSWQLRKELWDPESWNLGLSIDVSSFRPWAAGAGSGLEDLNVEVSSFRPGVPAAGNALEA